MAHAVRDTWTVGLRYDKEERRSARLHTAIEAGYLAGSLLCTVGTIFFFPTNALENYAVGTRLYEAGSTIFAVLTLYSQVSRCQARRQQQDGRTTTKREVCEAFLYCSGSFLFLIGTFLYDPASIQGSTRLFRVSEATIYNAASVMFMVGSFAYSLGSYVNALSIFEAPKMFRVHFISIATCYQFGGLFFVAGSMGFVEAFQPNKTMKWAAAWLYLVGCLCYVFGSLLSLVSTIASHQVRWERLRDDERKKRRSIARQLVDLPRAALRAAVGRRRRRRAAAAGAAGCDPWGVVVDVDISGEDIASDGFEDGSLENDGPLGECPAAARGPAFAGRDAAAALADAAGGRRPAPALARAPGEQGRGGEPVEAEVELMGVFWRSVWAPAGVLHGDDEDAAWAVESPDSSAPVSPVPVGATPLWHTPAPETIGARGRDIFESCREQDDLGLLDGFESPKFDPAPAVAG